MTTGPKATSSEQALRTDDDPLAEVMRRLVPIHAALAERPGGDAELQRWTRRSLMDVIEYIDDVRNAQTAAR